MTSQNQRHDEYLNFSYNDSDDHHKHRSSLLELQAADYFKLDPAQVNMLNRKKKAKSRLVEKNYQQQNTVISNEHIKSKLKTNQQIQLNVPQNNNNNIKVMKKIQKNNQRINDEQNSNKKSSPYYNDENDNKSEQTVLASSATYLVGSSTTSTNSLPSISSSPSVSPSLLCPHLTLNDILLKKQKDLINKSPNTIGLCSKCRLDPPPNIHSPLSPIFNPIQQFSTNNETITRRCSSQSTNKSNMLKQNQYQRNIGNKNLSIKDQKSPTRLTMKRGYSDHQAGLYSSKFRDSLQFSVEGASDEINNKLSINDKRKLLKSKQDDSLDYYLEPNELKKLQLSPTLRHSVEFIRKNSTETGRILKIYKNGLPYDKPLRICIMRGEFSTLNNLLDYINSRQLIPSGARYLFHLDGSLVYSVNELKHDHIYIVSGTRTFDYRSNKLIREKNSKEFEKLNINDNRNYLLQQQQQIQFYIEPTSASHNNNQKFFIPINQEPSNRKLISNNETYQPMMRTRSKSNLSNSNLRLNSYSTNNRLVGNDNLESRKEISLKTKTKSKQKLNDQINIDNEPKKKTLSTQKSNIISSNNYNNIKATQTSNLIDQTKQRNKQQSGINVNYHIKSNKFQSQIDLTDTDSNGDNNLSEKEATILQHQQEKPINLVRAKSELSAIPNKRKKNVTFVDTFKENRNENYQNRSISPHGIVVSNTVIEKGLFKQQGKMMMMKPQTEDNFNVVRKDDKTTKRNDNTSSNSLSRALETNEIGIQVSESIDGFLIDLPIAMPPKGEERRGFLRKGQGNRSRYLGKSVGTTTNISNFNKTQPANKNRPKTQIVTLTERQLSFDEMDKLKDLDHGDHHREKVLSKVSELSDSPSSSSVKNVDEETIRKLSNVSLNNDEITICINDPNEVITIGSELKNNEEKINSNKDDDKIITNNQIDKHNKGTNWQYPVADGSDGKTTTKPNRIASATPTERPVSQSEANEVVHARVTTPTPSLSTANDTNSLTMSYEMSNLNSIDRLGEGLSSSIINGKQNFSIPSSIKSELEKRCLVPVVGRLVSGTNPTSKNFKLTWVNGFCINDRYPENSINYLSTNVLNTNDNLISSSSSSNYNYNDDKQNERAKMLSPTATIGLSSSNQIKKTIQFKPSERFNNWIIYSKKYFELIYPAGSLIVLWCRLTNEQRFYSNHTSSICCLTLASLDLDLVASAQIEDNQEKILPNIHLWSLKSLETIKIIDNDLFNNQLIYSLKIKNNLTDGCELLISARDDKKLWLYLIYIKLLDNNLNNNNNNEENKSMKESNKINNKLLTNQINIIKVNKLLQGNQKPLIVTKLSNAKTEIEIDKKLIEKTNASSNREEEIRKGSISSLTKSSPNNTPKKSPLLLSRQSSTSSLSSKQQKQSIDDDGIIISFGRRHFQLWNLDKKQLKLNSMKLENKNNLFVDVMLKANCLIRLSPKEFLIGDLDGRINLINISYKKPTTKIESTNQTYTIETINLLDNNKSSLNNKFPSITCIARITGSLIVTSDSNCVIKFWKIKRTKKIIDKKLLSSSENGEEQEGGGGGGDKPEKNSKTTSTKFFEQIKCYQLSSINLPQDLGFICTIIVSDFNRLKLMVDLYLVSTSNVILFGSIQLPPSAAATKINSKKTTTMKTNDYENLNQDVREQMLANSYLFVVYEGHETSVMNLVADIPKASELFSLRRQSSLNNNNNNNNNNLDFDKYYFTCSIDCRICKWNGKSLIWKSMLPSACSSMAVHPVGSVLAVGSGDGTVYILDKTSGLLISYFPLTPVCINCLAYSIDGTLLAAGCANGSIFILPVYDRGLKYKKVSIFQSPYPVVSLQFSTNNQYILTSVTHGSYQELILWDLPNFRYMRENVKLTVDKIEWFDSICSGSEDVRAIWENSNLTNSSNNNNNNYDQQQQLINNNKSTTTNRLSSKGPLNKNRDFTMMRQKNLITKSNNNFVINLSCHRLIRSKVDLHFESNDSENQNINSGNENLIIASDTRGYLRLFRYPCYDIEQAFFEIKISSTPVNCCRFLAYKQNSNQEPMFVSSAIDGSICIWTLN